MKKRKKDPEIPLAMILCKNLLKKKTKTEWSCEGDGGLEQDWRGGRSSAGQPRVQGEDNCKERQETKTKKTKKDKMQRQKRLRKTRSKDKERQETKTKMT